MVLGAESNNDGNSFFLKYLIYQQIFSVGIGLKVSLKAKTSISEI
jgi:hypothetical protein